MEVWHMINFSFYGHKPITAYYFVCKEMFHRPKVILRPHSLWALIGTKNEKNTHTLHNFRIGWAVFLWFVYSVSAREGHVLGFIENMNRYSSIFQHGEN